MGKMGGINIIFPIFMGMIIPICIITYFFQKYIILNIIIAMGYEIYVI